MQASQRKKVVEQIRYLITKRKGHFNVDSISFKSKGFPQVPSTDISVILRFRCALTLCYFFYYYLFKELGHIPLVPDTGWKTDLVT